MDNRFLEYRTISHRASWGILIVLCLFLLGWGVMNQRLIHDTPHQWRLGNLPATPGESIYSTSEPGDHRSPRQLQPLPQEASQPAEGEVSR